MEKTSRGFHKDCRVSASCKQMKFHRSAWLDIYPQITIAHMVFCQKRGILLAARLGRFGGVFFLAEVRVQEGEPLENALRRFKRKVQTEDIIKEVKRHSFYLKPGEKKRVKEALARKRNRKKVRKEQD